MVPIITVLSGFGQWLQDVRHSTERQPLVHVVITQLIQNNNGVDSMSTTKIVDASALASVLIGKDEVEVEVGHGSSKAVVNLQRVVDGVSTLMGVSLPTSMLEGPALKAGARYKVVASGDVIQTLAPKAAPGKKPASNGCTLRDAIIMGSRMGSHKA